MWGDRMKFNVKKIVVKPISKGAEAVLRSEPVKEVLKDVAEEIAYDLYDITSMDSDEHWEVKEDSHSDRPVFNITNDDPNVKWREVADGSIARDIQSRQKKAPPRGRSCSRVRRK